MCQFLSALLFQNGRIICDPEHTDSHSDLILANNLKGDESLFIRSWIRVEFYPDNSTDITNPEKYQLHVDETSTPDWFDKAKHFETSEILRDKIKRMIIADVEIPLLLGGCWILEDKANVHAIRNSRILSMRDSSRVGAMLESSRVGEMRDSSQVGMILESSRVGMMWGSSRVGEMRDSSQVGMILESSRVGMMWDSSRVGEMRDSSRVGEMWGSSRVGTMRDSSRVGEMWGSSRVGNDKRKKATNQ